MFKNPLNVLLLSFAIFSSCKGTSAAHKHNALSSILTHYQFERENYIPILEFLVASKRPEFAKTVEALFAHVKNHDRIGDDPDEIKNLISNIDKFFVEPSLTISTTKNIGPFDLIKVLEHDKDQLHKYKIRSQANRIKNGIIETEWLNYKVEDDVYMKKLYFIFRKTQENGKFTIDVFGFALVRKQREYTPYWPLLRKYDSRDYIKPVLDKFKTSIEARTSSDD